MGSDAEAGEPQVDLGPGGGAGAETDAERETQLEKLIKNRDKLDSLLRRTIQTKKNCDKLQHDNKYLQEYVGNLMNSGDFDKA